MRHSILAISAVVAIAFTASSASAQATRAGGGRQGAQEHRTELRDRLKNMTPEERKAALENAKDRREDAKANATDEQKAWRTSMQTQLKSTRDAVKAGTLTRQTAASQLKAWREANPRPTK